VVEVRRAATVEVSVDAVGRHPRRIVAYGDGERLGALPRRFCAVGGHSPALWRTGGETPAGAFDDAEDFARHDLFGDPARGRAPVWIDVGTDDPFLDAARGYAQLLQRHGRQVTLHVTAGGHDRVYWKRHLDEYLRFYADALARC